MTGRIEGMESSGPSCMSDELLMNPVAFVGNVAPPLRLLNAVNSVAGAWPNVEPGLGNSSVCGTIGGVGSTLRFLYCWLDIIRGLQ